jgi:hypothetical protein
MDLKRMSLFIIVRRSRKSMVHGRWSIVVRRVVEILGTSLGFHFATKARGHEVTQRGPFGLSGMNAPPALYRKAGKSAKVR